MGGFGEFTYIWCYSLYPLLIRPLNILSPHQKQISLENNPFAAIHHLKFSIVSFRL